MLRLLLALAGLAAVARAGEESAELFEGDIQTGWGLIAGEYTPALADELLAAGLIDPPSDGRRELGIHTSSSLLWNNRQPNGKVQIPLAYSSIYSGSQVNFIRNAANALATAVGVLEFVDRTTEVIYIEFVEGSGCSSRIGRGSGRQEISLLRNGCLSTGTVQHEIMHALGFWHEQSRTDRDSYVTINLQNVEPGKEHNFDKRSTRDLGVSYDYGSVMHYGRTAFSIDRINLDTITAPVAIGQRSGASAKDIQQIQLLYGLTTPNPTSPTNKPTSPTPKPTSPTPKPTSPTPKPTSPTPKPSSPTPKPTSPTNKPTSPTQNPTVKPTLPTNAPTPPTRAPTLPTSAPTNKPSSASPSAAPTMPVCAAADWTLWTANGPQDPSEDSAVRGCGTSCGAVDSGACLTTCMQTTAGYSASCSGCFGDFSVCIKSSCGCALTASGLNASCAGCGAVPACQSAFRACTGGFEVRSLPATTDDRDEEASSPNVPVIAGIGAGFVLVMLAVSGALVAVRRRANARRAMFRSNSAVNKFGTVAAANPVFQDAENRKYFHVDV